MTAELMSLSALELAAAIARGDYSSTEVTSFYLDRIAKHNKTLHAFCDVRPEVTLAEAKRRDRRSGDASTPFWGVPIAIKDLNFAGGFFTRLGSRTFENFYSPSDDKNVARLRAAGFVILGKTSVPEFGTIPWTEPMIHPPARNPWDFDMSPGGSSGGSAVAVAAGLAPIASASDGGGSIRIPAALCNLYGFKASRGRIQNAYGHNDETLLYTDGVLTRSVAETAHVLDLLSGVHFGKTHWAPAPEEHFSKIYRRDPKPLRIGLSLSSPLVKVEPDIRDALERAARHLESRGHQIVELPFPTADTERFMTVWKKYISTIRYPDEHNAEPLTRWFTEAGRRIPNDVAQRAFTETLRDLEQAYAQADAWLSPCVPIAHYKIGAFQNLTPPDVIAEGIKIAAYTAGYNLTGYPAASVPVGWSSDRGHPIAVQIGSGRFDDAIVLQISRQLEEAFPRSANFPPGFQI